MADEKADETLRARLTAPKDKPAGEFALEADGLVVYLRRWSVADRMRVQSVGADRERPALERQADMLRLILCDAKNRRLFPDGDDAVLGIELGADADRIINAALDANGLGDKSVEKKATS